jgi:hypothetical protein
MIVIYSCQDVYKEEAHKIVDNLAQKDSERGARLEQAFRELTADVKLIYQNVERAKFAVNFECFIIQAQQVFLTM